MALPTDLRGTHMPQATAAAPAAAGLAGLLRNDANGFPASCRSSTGTVNTRQGDAVELARAPRRPSRRAWCSRGHSRGGGRGHTASPAAGNRAVGVNSAGVADETMRDSGLDPGTTRAEPGDRGQIRDCVIERDILTHDQAGSGPAGSGQSVVQRRLPDAVGIRIVLPGPFDQPDDAPLGHN